MINFFFQFDPCLLENLALFLYCDKLNKDINKKNFRALQFLQFKKGTTQNHYVQGLLLNMLLF